MTKLVWDQVGSRTYETGIDRGVLYVGANAYPWSGLTSVKETSVGGEHRAYYIDGVRYANRVALEEYEAAISAYTYPPAFEECDGTKTIGNGLFVTKQRRKPFNFAYRTLIGDDVLGSSAGYKLHLVYNATALPTDREYSTLSDSVEPFVFSWKIVARPPILDFSPTAHLIIDSRSTPGGLLSQIEDILYGSAALSPRFPTMGELISKFANYANPSALDAGDSNDAIYVTYDAGSSTTPVTTTFDGGVG